MGNYKISPPSPPKKNFKIKYVEVTKKIETTTTKTYAKGIEGLKQSIASFKSLGYSNLLHRKMLFQSIINSKLTHLHRVLVPTPEQIEKIDKLTRSALWTKSFKGHEYGRTKISKKKLEAPLVAGGGAWYPSGQLSGFQIPDQQRTGELEVLCF